MQPENKSLAGRIEPETSKTPVTINYQRRDLDMYYVFRHELETIGTTSGHGSLFQTFFGASFGAAISLGLTLWTVPIASPNLHTSFVGAFIVSVAATLLFFGLAITDWLKSSKQVRAIIEESRKREPSAG